MSNQDQTSYTLEELSRESGIETRVIRSFIENGLLRGPGKLGRYARYSRTHLNRLLAIKVMKDRQGMRLSEVRQQLLFMSEAEINALAETRGPEPDRGVQAPGSALDYIRAHSQVFLDFGNPGSNHALPRQLEFDSHEDDDLDARFESSASDNDDQCRSHTSLAASIRAKLSDMAEAEASLRQQQCGPTPPASESDADSSDQTGQRLAGWGPAAEDGRENDVVQAAKPVSRLIDGLRQLVGERPIRKQSKSQQWHHIQITPDIELSVRGVPDEQQLAHLERVADYLRELLTGAGYE